MSAVKSQQQVNKPEFYFSLTELANVLKVQLNPNESDAEALRACTKRAKQLMEALEEIYS